MRENVNVKRILTFVIISFVILFTSCSNSNNESKENVKYEYSSYDDVSYISNHDFEYWNVLSPKAKMYYDAISKGVYNNRLLYRLNGSDWYDDAIQIEIAKNIYRLDHPENELCDYSIIAGTDDGISQVKIYSNHDEQEYLEKIQEIDSEIEQLVKEVNNTTDIVSKYRLIFDWLTSSIKYDRESVNESINAYQLGEFGYKPQNNCQNLYGAIIEKQAVCKGIADAFKYICDKCNLECFSVQGDVNGTYGEFYDHQWNVVEIDDSYFLIDCTAALPDDGQLENPKRYEFFLNENLTLDNRKSNYDVPGYN